MVKNTALVVSSLDFGTESRSFLNHPFILPLHICVELRKLALWSVSKNVCVFVTVHPSVRPSRHPRPHDSLSALDTLCWVAAVRVRAPTRPETNRRGAKVTRGIVKWHWNPLNVLWSQWNVDVSDMSQMTPVLREIKPLGGEEFQAWRRSLKIRDPLLASRLECDWIIAPLHKTTE